MSKLLVVSCVLLWVVLPTVFFKPSGTISSPAALAALYYVCLFAWLLSASALLKRRSGSRSPLFVLAAVAGLYFSVTYVLIGYRLYAGHYLDARYALDAAKDIPASLSHVLGPAFAGLVLAVIATWVAFAGMVVSLGRLETSTLKTRPGIVLFLSTAALGIFPGSVSFIGQSLSNLLASSRYYADVRLIAEPVDLMEATQPEDNFFFLQLESVNALAAFGKAVVHGKAYQGHYVPRLENIAKQGVLFPFAWGNTIQTARATEAIHCGVSNNVGPPLTLRPEQITTPCLPELLRRHNYSTLYFRGVPDPSFNNIEAFLLHKGFERVIGPELMADDPQSDAWGFEECRFIEKTFAYLARERPDPKRLFVQVSVSRSHFPFGDTNRDPDRPFIEPGNFVEGYLNSLARQDTCVDTFWRRFNSYAGDHSHLLIFGDHSWPVGINGNIFNETGSQMENFLTPVLYVPPRARRNEFAIDQHIDVKIGQTDFPSTVLDLLGLGTGTNSFAPLLKGQTAPQYEECHMMVQPYGDPSIVVARKRDKFTYHLSTRTLEVSDFDTTLSESPPRVIGNDVSYSTFQKEHGCRRYGGSR